MYDKWHQAEFARPNLDVYLPKLYHDRSFLLVFFLCGEYAAKEWCGLEWRAGRDLLKKREDDRLMFLRLDRADIPGLYSIDGYLDIANMADEDVAREILRRLEGLALASITDGIDTIVKDLRERTFAQIHDRCGTIRILTMERPIQLDGVFTDVNLLQKRPANARKMLQELIEEAQLGAFGHLGAFMQNTERVRGRDVFEDHRRIMIYGKPGAGKTTFLKRLAVECAMGRLLPKLVPAFVPLRDFAEADGSTGLIGYIQRGWADELRSHEVFCEGRALILLDGLDEVRDKDFGRVRKAIEELVTEFPHVVTLP